MRNLLMSGLAAAALLVGAAAPTLAQPAASDVPAYAQAASPENRGEIRGRIESIPGKYQIEVRDVRGFVDNVALHQGTVINPTGIQLQPGMQVTIYGHPEGKAFAANTIDTPYQSAYVRGYPGAWFGYRPRWGVGFGMGW